MPPRPSPLPVSVGHIPETLKALKQWVAWQYELREGQWTKVPINPKTGFPAKAGAPETLGTSGQAIARYQRQGTDGVGFQLTATDPYIGVDLDHCRDAETGAVQAWAQHIIDRLDSYTEVSPSGQGIRICVAGKLPVGGRRKGGVEMYGEKRYLTTTGSRLTDCPDTIQERQAEIDAFHAEIFGPAPPHEAPQPRQSHAAEPSATVDHTASWDDHTIIEKALGAENGEKFARLWAGDIAAYGNDDSRADMALCCLLVFWTRDAERIDRIFRRSKLYREKWERDDYRQRTIQEALRLVKESWTPPEDANEAEALEARIVEAREKVKDLGPQLKANVGYIFDTPDIVSALVCLYTYDRGEWERIRLILKPYNQIKRVEAAIKARIQQHAAATGYDQKAVGVFLPDAPVPMLIVPERYYLGAHETGRLEHQPDDQGNVVEQRRVMTNAPVLISGTMHDIDEGTRYLALQWRRETWVQHIVDRGHAFDPNELQKLATFDFPVGHHNKADLATYLFKFEETNYYRMPRMRISSHFGWQGTRGDLGFLWGRNLIRAMGTYLSDLDAGERPAEDWKEDFVTFHGPSAGESQLAAGYHAHGTLQEWQQLMATCRPYPKVTIALYAGFVAPLLEILGIANFTIDWSGRSSHGKTTTLRVPASIWGRPEQKSPSAAMFSWSQTKVNLGRMFGVLTGLPIILDDTKLAASGEIVDFALYLLHEGRDKGRGSPKGTQKVKTWRTVLLVRWHGLHLMI